MYQFDFVRISEDEEENVISVKAMTYEDAVKKVRKIGFPDFILQEWRLEGVYEQGTLLSERSN